MRKLSRIFVMTAVLGFTACNSSNLSLPMGEIESVIYEEMNFEKTNREVSMTSDMIARLNEIKLCGTGFTTVTEYFNIEYRNGDKARFGVVNWSSEKEPSYSIYYKFPEDKGWDLKYPCTNGQHQKLVDLFRVLIPEPL